MREIYFALVELQAGGSTFEDISVSGSQDGNTQNPIAWDGKYLDLGSYENTGQRHHKSRSVIERLAISGSDATVVGYTPLSLQREAQHMQFFISGATAI